MRSLAHATLVTLAILPLFIGAAAAEPVAAFTPAAFELGKVEIGDPGKTTVAVKNTGDEPLIIKSAKPSCTCIKVTAPTGPIMPGESATIVAVYDTSHAGLVAKSVALTLNTASGNHTLSVRGYVNPPADSTGAFAPKP